MRRENGMKDIFDFYEQNEYGYWRSGETVTYKLLEEVPDTEKPAEEESFFEKIFGSLKGSTKIKICVSNQTGASSFEVNLFAPKPEDRFLPDGKCPVIVSMHPIKPKETGLLKGYAFIFLNPGQIASDDIKHQGCFYDLYPYGTDPKSQTGVLSAWAWGASKVLDALENGLAEEFGIDISGTVVTGVSRFGKAAAVCGAFEKRFAMTAPACSGAGGLALYKVFSEGNTYDLSEVGGPEAYTYTKNEPLDCLQSDAERGWFCDAFLQYHSPDEIPVDQEMLPVMAMGKDRLYFVIAAMMSEDWVNAPSMWECFVRAKKIYDENGLSEHIASSFHREGHAVLEEDLEKMILFFNKMHYGIENGLKVESLQRKVFREVPKSEE